MIKPPFLYILSALILCFEARSQNGLFINGNNACLTINSNSRLYVNGDLQNINSSPITGLTNNGTVILTGNFTNNDSLYNDRPNNLVPGSTFILAGNSNQIIRGTAPTPFFKLIINKRL